ncbi:MAG: response regulator [Rubrivivax sp.]|nr:response regulator [Rubrivivax sp.]
MPLDHHSVLIVDDNPGDADLASERLAEAPGCDFETRCATTLAQALEAIAERPPEAVILDLNLPDSTGLQTLHRVHRAAAATPVIVVSGVVDGALRIAALQAGAVDVLSKDETSGRLFCRSVLYVIERQRARLQHRQLEQLLDATPDAMLVVNGRSEVRFVNRAAMALFGLSHEELLRERLAFAVGDGDNFELVVPRRDAEPRVCEMRVVVMEWNGEQTHLASMRDITERKQAEELRRRSVELQVQNVRIQQASDLKSAFVAHMSHEIRTPMNAVIGLTHLLAQTPLDDDQHAMLGQLRAAGTTLMGLLDNVLDLSKIEAGEVAIERVPFELPALVDEVVALFAPQARAKGLALEVRSAAGLPRWVLGDPMRLRQILTNLLGNAVKFTESGGVTLAIDDHPPGLRFAVRDTGIGIDADAQARLFTPFMQADATTTRRFGGTGLGLSIVRRLAELMGGRVTVCSEPGVGSAFDVELPLRETAAPLGSALGVRLLAVGSTIAARWGGPAADLGWMLDVLDDADTGSLRHRLQHHPRPDAVLSEAPASAWVAAVCPEATDGSAGPPCLVLDGLPPTAGRLYAAVDAQLRARCGIGVPLDGTRVGSGAVHWLPGTRLLVVDDSDINREVARRLLEREGAEVHGCADAMSALRRLADVGDRFDAVLLDVQMPEVDGVEAARRIRALPRLGGLPLIALSAGALVAERQRALDAGMDDFLVKPIDPAALVRALRRHIEAHRGCALAVEDAPADSGLQPGGPATGQALARIDGLCLPRHFASNTSLWRRLARALVDEYADLAEACPDGREPAETPRRRLHKLQGAAGALGLDALHRIASDLGTGLSQAGGGAAAGPSWSALAAALRRLRRQLAELPMTDAAVASSTRGCAGDTAALRQLLHRHDLEAIACLDRQAETLQDALGPVRYATLRSAVEGLDYPRAVELLDGC